MKALDFVKMMVANYHHLRVDVKRVQVTSQVHPRSEQNRCFNNAFKVLLHEAAGEQSKYVLGFLMTQDGCPIEHAWVKRGAKHVDVTLSDKIIANHTFISVAEFSFMEVAKYVSEKHYAPGLYEMDRFIQMPK